MTEPGSSEANKDEQEDDGNDLADKRNRFFDDVDDGDDAKDLADEPNEGFHGFYC